MMGALESAQRRECKEEKDEKKQEADKGEQKFAQLGKLVALAARGESCCMFF